MKPTAATTWASLSDYQQGILFYAHTMAFVTLVMKRWLEREITMGSPKRINPMTHSTMSKCSYHRTTSRSMSWKCFIACPDKLKNRHHL